MACHADYRLPDQKVFLRIDSYGQNLFVFILMFECYAAFVHPRQTKLLHMLQVFTELLASRSALILIQAQFLGILLIYSL